METVLFLLVIAAVTAVFLWLWRSLGDEWPPETPEEGEALAEATTIRSEAIPPVEAASPVSESRTGASAVPLEAPATPLVPMAMPVEVETPVAAPEIETSVPSQEEAPLAEIPDVPARRVATPLLVGGLLLLVATQLTLRATPVEERSGLFLLTLLGGIVMLLGVQTFMRGRVPGWLSGILDRIAAFLRVDQGQAVMLLLSLPFAWLGRLAAGDGLLAYQPVVAVLSWLLAIALAIAGSVSRETSAAAPRRSFDRWDWLLMGGLFVVALILRGVATAQFPNTFSGDEGSAGLFGVMLLNGQVNNPFTVGWFSFPSLYFAVQSIAIGLGGQTVEAVRVTSAIAGALSVIAVYALARSMFDRTTAVLAAAYLAASHYHIHMSRIALNNVWDGLFGTLAILGLWAGWKTGRRSAFILSGLALGIGQYFYVAIRMLPVIFLIWSAVAWWRQRAQFRLRLPGLVVAALIALVVFLPLGLFFAEKPDEFQAPLNRVTIFGDWLEGELSRGDRSTAEIIADQALAEPWASRMNRCVSSTTRLTLVVGRRSNAVSVGHPVGLAELRPALFAPDAAVTGRDCR
ncbi:MAG: glycosyltransferase family 39 protein [Chloroflexota bacterium]